MINKTVQEMRIVIIIILAGGNDMLCLALTEPIIMFRGGARYLQSSNICVSVAEDFFHFSCDHSIATVYEIHRYFSDLFFAS